MTLNLRYSVFFGGGGGVLWGLQNKRHRQRSKLPLSVSLLRLFWERWFCMTLNKEGKDDIPPVGDFVNFLVSVFM